MENPFQIEEERARLSTSLHVSQINELVQTYSEFCSEIPNKNTPGLWDKLNLQEKPLITKNPMEKDRLKTVLGFIKGKNLQIMNIGFGSGNLERMYVKKQSFSGIHWYGIDISPASVKKVQKEFPQGNFEVGNILKMRFPHNYFDYVIAIEVLEHISPRNTFHALREIHRVIKPAGYFILSVPLNEALEEMIIKGENPNAHVRIYTPELIQAELYIAGFTVLREKKLFAFHNWYSLKTFIAKYLLIRKCKPNNIILLAQKSNMAN